MSIVNTPTAFADGEDVVQQENAALSEGADAAANTGTAYSMGVGDTFSGSIGAGGDNDWIAITLAAGSNTQISLTSTGATGLDTFLELYDSSGTLVASNDDSGPGLNSLLSFAATTGGTYYINARSYNNTTAGTYQISATELGGPLPTYSYDQIADYLVTGYWAETGRAQRSFNVGADGSIDVDITSLNAAGQQLATWALEAWTNVTGINFNFVDETSGATAEIFFDDTGAGLDAFNSSTTSGTNIIRSEITITTGWITSAGHGGTGIDSYSFQTYMHELGHALGLGHAGNYNGSATYVTTGGGSGNNHYLNDSWQATIMSYMSQTENTSINASYAYTVTPMIADILAIQSLYGVGGNLRTGNTTYGENSNAGGYLDSLTGLTNAIAITVLDDGGVDTFDFGSATAAQVIDLRQEAISSIYGLVGNLVIARGTVIENVISGSGADTITGNDADNVINGGGGADTIDGGGGNDTAVFSGNRSLYSITTTGATTTVSFGGTTTTLTNIELLQFSDQTVSIGGANTPPTATLENLSMDANSWNHIGTSVAYSDPDSDPAVQYQIWDSEGGTNLSGGSNSFWIQGVGYVDATSGYTLTAAQLTGLWLLSDASAGSQNLQIRANDGNGWGAWDSFTLTTNADPGSPPTATLENLSMDANSWNHIGTSVAYSDPDSDPAVQYQIWDREGGTNLSGGSNSFWVQDVGYVDATSGYTLTAAQLADLWLLSDSSAGSQNLWIRADDGSGWGAWDRFTLTTNAASASPPTATLENLSMGTNAWNNIGTSVVYSDPNSDPAVQYRIWDSEGGTNSNGDSNSFWLQGVGYVDATSGYTLTAAQLAGLWLRSDSSAGSQNLWIRADDGSGWGAWDSFTLTTGTGMEPLADFSDAFIF